MEKAEREKLTEIIEQENGSKWWDPQEFQRVIRAQLPTQLTILTVPPNPAANYNCFVYAFGLEEDPEFLGGQNPIQKEFVRYLLNQHALERIESPSAGDLVFYEDKSGAVTHGGIVQVDGSILSKWMWGALFSHKLWDVPSSFGDKVFYCKRPDPKEVKRVYIEYKNSGVKIAPIS